MVLSADVAGCKIIDTDNEAIALMFVINGHVAK